MVNKPAERRLVDYGLLPLALHVTLSISVRLRTISSPITCGVLTPKILNSPGRGAFGLLIGIIEAGLCGERLMSSLISGDVDGAEFFS
ncbi:MAG TPA: hypothetical protein VFY05_01600 [Candidatus Angelobacter sp.]|nr:hypothetical protein [Candidatus Angelobacter sp.]